MKYPTVSIPMPKRKHMRVVLSAEPANLNRLNHSSTSSFRGLLPDINRITCLMRLNSLMMTHTYWTTLINLLEKTLSDRRKTNEKSLEDLIMLLNFSTIVSFSAIFGPPPVIKVYKLTPSNSANFVWRRRPASRSISYVR